MPVHDDLGTRMKTFYEQVPKFNLYRRTPVAIRLDDRAFHTFTRDFQEPYHEVFSNAMIKTMDYLCRSIQGCVFGYTQSDEITLVLCDYQTLETAAWFDYQVQKMCSVAASMCTMYFNKNFRYWVDHFKSTMTDTASNRKYLEVLQNKLDKAMFDARCFNIPKEEVTNCVLWRQNDATRNSIQSVGQFYFSHKELQNKTCDEIQEMLFTQKGLNWNNLDTNLKRGTAVVKRYKLDSNGWEIDREMPILKGEDREYIEKLINFD
jgi:tRNA(His) 5'-end guanylyltransferase